MVEVKIEGLEAINKAIFMKLSSAKEVKKIVAQHGSALQTKTQDNMNSTYTHGYSTGKTARETNLELSNGGLTATVAPHTDYFEYLEYGTRKMEAMPTLHPAFIEESELFKKDILDVFKK